MSGLTPCRGCAEKRKRVMEAQMLRARARGTTVDVPLPRIVMASGVFDLLHRGHVNLLWRAKMLGDVLVVGVVSDAGTEAYKHRRPVESEQDRITAVQQLGFVDQVLLQDGTDPTPLLGRVRPDVLCHGDDWTELLEGNDTVRQMGIEFVLLPYTPEVSTTQLREVTA